MRPENGGAVVTRGRCLSMSWVLWNTCCTFSASGKPPLSVTAILPSVKEPEEDTQSQKTVFLFLQNTQPQLCIFKHFVQTAGIPPRILCAFLWFVNEHTSGCKICLDRLCKISVNKTKLTVTLSALAQQNCMLCCSAIATVTLRSEPPAH